MDFKLPPELKWIARELSGYAHQTVQINATGTNNVGPSGMLQFDFPIAKYDFRTLALAFDVTAWTTDGTANTALPYHTHSLFGTQTVTVGGQVIESVSQRNHLHQLWTDYTGSTNNDFDSILSLSETIQYIDGTQVSPALPAVGFISSTGQVNNGGNAAITNAISDPTAGASINSFPAVLKFPLGFLGSVKICDLEMTGALTLQLQASDASVLMCGNEATSAPATLATCSFLIANARLYVNKVNIADELFDMVKREHRKMYNGRFIIPYKRWYSFSRGPVTGSTSFQVNVQSESVNAVLATFTPQVQFSPPTTEDKRSPWCVRNATGLQYTNIVYSGEQYPQFNLPAAYAANMTGTLFENNYSKTAGALVPGGEFGATGSEAAGGLVQFLRQMFVFGYRWSLNNDLYDTSGLRTMGNTAPIEWRLQYNGAAPTGTAAVNAQMFVETTARLICDENRVVTIRP